MESFGCQQFFAVSNNVFCLIKEFSLSCLCVEYMARKCLELKKSRAVSKVVFNPFPNDKF